MIKVSVCIITYNQEQYLAQAIEGVLMQETSHPYEIIIGEDCSTDNTRKICREYEKKYPGIIRIIYQPTNQGLILNFVSTIQASTGEYVALCDGDDYWIDPLKLEKQISHLDLNRDIGLVYTNKKILQNRDEHDGNSADNKTEIEDLLMNCFISSPTVLFRKALAEPFLMEMVQLSSVRDWKMQDYPLWLHIAGRSKIAYLDEYTAMYRMLSNTLCRPQDTRAAYDFDRSIIDVRHYFYTLFSKSTIFPRNFKNQFYEMIFHARKRMIIDYGWMARKEILNLFRISPIAYCYIIINKVKRIRVKHGS